MEVTDARARATEPGHPRLAVAIAAGLFALATAGLLAGDLTGFSQALFFVLIPLAIAGNVFAARYEGPVLISADFSCCMLAAAFLGPAPVYVMAVVVELGTWATKRYEPMKIVLNLGAFVAPMVGAALLFDTVMGAGADEQAGFIPALAVISILALAANYVTVQLLAAVAYGSPLRSMLRVPRTLLPSLAVNIALVLVIAALYEKAGAAASALVVVLVVGYAYMSHLVVRARNRTKQYANLSWGVLSGLVATLDARDARAARHCAAVAMFSRDIARHEGMSRRDQELAHTSGLLHDIGKFALSDRVMDGEAILTEEDWRGIRRHTVVGADLLKDLDAYGPVAQIVRAHHERLDGRGYPDRLKADEIPEIAKIVAVAEVYDTLTAPDTYRQPMSSFEALTELRRVSGSQLDGRHVEALAELLAGEGIDYRHADAADFDRELDIQRRMSDAAAR